MNRVWMILGLMSGLAWMLPAATLAQTEDPQTWHACRVPEVGVLYMIKEAGLPQECLSSTHVEFSWTETGQPGPAGPQGEPGPVGPEGPQGPAGDLEDIYAAGGEVEIAPGESGLAAAYCPSGRRPISGSYYAGSLEVYIAGVELGIHNRFIAAARNNVDAPVTLSVTANCVISPSN